jgi:hypothetical protein
VLADETGGFAVVNVDDAREGMERIVQANSFYYVLGYNSPNAKPDGKFRAIDVRVTKPGLRVTARKGFVVPKTAGENARTAAAADISPQLRRVIDNPLPVSGIEIATSAAAFRGGPDAPNRMSVAVTTEIDAATLKFSESAGVFRDTLEVALVLVDLAGTVRTGDRHSVDLKLKPNTYEKVTQTGIRLVSRILASPGRYQLKVAARETGEGRTGSVLYDLEVPDFHADLLSLSGVVLTSTRANTLLTVKPDAALEELLPAPPTTERSFTSADILAVAMELYDAVAPPEHIEVVATVIRDDGRLMFRAKEEAAPDGWNGQRYVYKVLIPMRDLAPASYTLNIEARSPSATNTPILSRTVPFQLGAGRGPDLGVQFSWVATQGDRSL